MIKDMALFALCVFVDSHYTFCVANTGGKTTLALCVVRPQLRPMSSGGVHVAAAF